MKLATIAAALMLALAVFVFAARSGPGTMAGAAQPDAGSPDPTLAAAEPADAARSAAAGPAESGADSLLFRGVAIQLQTGFGPVETYMPLIREIAALGADTVLLSTPALMEHARAQAIFIDARKSPSPPEFVALIKETKKLGLKVVLMPIVLLSHPRGSEWRGVIDPPDWDDWFRQYREFVAHFADIAREGGADAFLVGSELVSTEKYTAQWIRAVEVVRERFKGKLGYSANWDHYTPIQFWDKLDFVGMTSYYKLADRSGADVSEMIAKWQPIKEEILSWQKRIGKPIVLTEVGWCSQLGAATAPWNYYQNQTASPEGHEEQRRLYEAFLRVWEGTPQLGGVIWWEWTASDGGAEDYGYTPKHKPAEKILRDWFHAARTGGGSRSAAAASP